jgi:hypothetical protein
MVGAAQAAAGLTPEDEQILAEALLLWRYVGHRLPGKGGPDCNSEARAHLALQLAKRLRVFAGYWQLMQAADVLSIRVVNLDAPPKQRGGRRKKASPPALAALTPLTSPPPP